jgi:hypothetical protein
MVDRHLAERRARAQCGQHRGWRKLGGRDHHAGQVGGWLVPVKPAQGDYHRVVFADQYPAAGRLSLAGNDKRQHLGDRAWGDVQHLTGVDHTGLGALLCRPAVAQAVEAAFRR